MADPTFLQPSDGATVPVGKNITIVASASGPAKIAKVDFYINGTRLCSDNSAPYSCSWKIPSISGVLYTLEARAYDVAGGVASESIHVISGLDITPPTVGFTNVSDGGYIVVPARATLIAWAGDAVGVTKVEFYVNGSRTCTVYAAPYTCTWNVSSTAGVIYTLEARAYDAAGNVGHAVVHVISTPDITPPTVSFTNISDGGYVAAGKNVALSASAFDAGGVTKVDFYINGSRKCSDNTSPYSCTWNVPSTVGVIYTLEARAYDAAGNIGRSVVHVTSQ
jgi:hypothetical protein